MRAARLLPLALAAAPACNRQQAFLGNFNGPEAAAIVFPGEHSPFDEPVAFIANTRQGTLVPLDLKHATPLGDQAAAPWLAPRKVATGDVRQLGPVAVFAEDARRVTTFVSDLRHGVLVEAPYIEDLNTIGEPQPPVLAASTPLFTDADASGGSATLDGLELRHGYTTTEDWTLTFDGEAWRVEGTRSGRQADDALPGEWYTSDNREVTFTINGAATAGDTLTFTTDVGIVEHDLGGAVTVLSEIPGTRLFLVGTVDVESGAARLLTWDPATRLAVGSLSLPDGAQPWRITWDDAGTAYLADAALPLVWVLTVDRTDPASLAATTLDMPAPLGALAWVGDPGEPLFGDVPYNHLFVAPIGANRLDVLDLDTLTFLDANPSDGRPGGIDLRSPIVGLSASERPVRLEQESIDGARVDSKVVMVTTFDGFVRIAEGGTGCLATDEVGPRVVAAQNGDDVGFTDVGSPSNPTLYVDPDTSRPVSFPACGGIVRNGEQWTLTFDGATNTWEVEGTLSGLQANRARADRRYLSDNGALSFLILEGAAGSTDGDSFTFTVEDGVLRMGDALRAGAADSTPFELPAPPIVFTMEAGPTGGGWDVDRRQTHAIVPVTNSDIVVRIRVQGWSLEVVYE
jgi:hypothetical protein